MGPRCPYCGGELVGKLALPPFTPREQAIYDTVIAAGHRGIKSDELAIAMYDEHERLTPARMITLRTTVNRLNKRLALLGKRIKGSRTVGYRLVDYQYEA